MVSIKNTLLIAALELRRAFTTRRGITVIIAFALVWGLLLRYGVYGAAQWLNTGGNAIGAMINSTTIRSLLNWKVPEVSVFWLISLYLFPLFCLVLAADQTATDRTRGTLRLISLHATRGSIFIGRFTGMLLTQLMLLVLVIIATLVIVLLRDPALFAVAVETAVIVFVNLALLIAAYTAAMALISVFATSARQATTWAVILWIAIGLAIFWAGRYIPQVEVLRWILPGAHIKHLLQQNSWQTLQIAFVPLLQTLGLLTAGYVAMKVRDL
jgi:ABC-type transport system involved in multi-copper enzyme maturation permease subunit